MFPPAVFKPEVFSRPGAPASGLIPGTPSAGGNLLRKRPYSVALDGRFWVGEEAETLHAPQKRNALQTFSQAVLPAALLHRQRWRLGSVLADFLFLVLNFAVIGPLGVLLEFAMERDPAVFLRPLLLPVSGLGLLLLYGTLLTLLAHCEGVYKADAVREPREERLVLGKAVTWATLLVGAAIHQSGIHVISIAMLAGGASLTYLGMIGWREWQRRVAARGIENGRGVRNVLIVGSGIAGRKLAAYLDQHPAMGLVVRGFLSDNRPIIGDVLGRIEDLARIARSEFVDEIILTTPQQRELTRWVIREARRNRLDVKLIPDLFGFEAEALLENFGSVPVLTLHEEPIPALGLFLKRSVDALFSAAGLVAAAPLLAAIALLIKLDSAGSVLYPAPRVVRKGRNFICHKFRTMVTDADKLKEQLRPCNEREGPFFKIKNDPRITRVGRFLRRYSLDELPQLWNVLKGEMSLVGPRPHPLDDFEHYRLEHLRRLDVTPGLTGLWQVTARRDPSFQRNMALDLQYIEHWNLWMDLRILYKTISVVLQGSGA